MEQSVQQRAVMDRTVRAALFSLATFAAACSSTQSEGPAEASAARAPLGKADAIGSCDAGGGDDFCGGKSDSACWCDDLCVVFGDCCSDVQPVCEGDACQPVTCELFCENGFATDEEGCEICACEPAAIIPCGGFAGFVCPEGLDCVDIPDDGCDVDNGGADCLGMCVQPAGCTTEACGPAPGAPNFECDDGETIGGPACVEDEDGGCGWVFIECPDAGPTCEGSCGGQASEFGCWCDDLCEQFGDCCEDVSEVCVAPTANCGELACGPGEVCVTNFTQLGPQYSCAPLGGECDGQATCGCMGTEVCTGVFDLCSETDDGLGCACPVC